MLLKLRSLILLFLIPTLALITLVMAIVIYRDIYRTILYGFDRKLYSLTALTAAFVDPKVHNEVLNFKQVRGVDFDVQSQTLYYSYANEDSIFASRAGGATTSFKGLGVGSIADITYDPKRGRLYLIDADAMALVSLDVSQGKVSTIKRLGEDEACFGLGLDRREDKLYCSGANLVRINPADGQSEIVGPLDRGSIQGLAYDDVRNKLLGIDSQNGEVVTVNTANAAVEPTDVSVTPLVVNENQKERLAYFGLGYDSIEGSYYTATTGPLLKFKGTTSEVKTLNRPGLTPFLDLVNPMIRVRERTNLTYLYTAILIDRGTRIAYIIDSTQDETNAFTGYQDSDAAESRIQDVWWKGEAYISDIKPWEDWGLLKSGYFPIFDDKGEIRAMAGTDINISIIQEKTRSALLQVLGIGLGSVVLGLLVSVYISNLLIRPIGKLKETALSVAAGNYGQKIEIDRPKELKALSKTFTHLSTNLKESLESISRANKEMEKSRLRQDYAETLRAHLFRKTHQSLSHAGFSVEKWIDGVEFAVLRKEKQLFIALMTPGDLNDVDRLQNLQTTLLLASTAKGKKPDQIISELQSIFPKDLGAMAILDLNTKAGEGRSTKEIRLLAGPKGKEKAWSGDALDKEHRLLFQDENTQEVLVELCSL